MKSTVFLARTRTLLLLLGLMIAALPRTDRVDAAAYIVAGETRPDVVTHVLGYTGTGGVRNISIGIDPTSPNASSMVIPTQNVINTFNALQVTTGNLQTANVPPSEVDFESILLHEMGHALGLAHPNLANESGLTEPDRNYTKSTDGANNSFDLGIGVDGIRGSSDDSRGDDFNLNWFNTTSNDPAAALPATVDHSTYSRSFGDLPGAHTFAANGDRDVLNNLAYPNTETVMQQGAPTGEAQRTLTAEDVAGLRIAMAGLDDTQGTGDDYTINLTYAGLTTSADIVIDFDQGMENRTDFAVTDLAAGSIILATHWSVTSASIYFDNGTEIGNTFTWFFNQVPNGFDPDDLYVDFTAGSNGVGTEASPMDNLADAVSAANTNATINLEPGSSLETFTGGNVISKPLTLLNNTPGGGVVRIGGS